MLGQYKPSEAEFIDIRVALPHEGEDGLFFATASCGSQHDVEMTNAWIGPDFPDTIPNTQHMPPVVELLANMIDGKIQKITDTIISQEKRNIISTNHIFRILVIFRIHRIGVQIMEMMPIGGPIKMYVKLYFVGQSDNQVRVEFIPQVTMIMPNGKHFLEGNVYSMWVCEEELPPTSDVKPGNPYWAYP